MKLTVCDKCGEHFYINLVSEDCILGDEKAKINFIQCPSCKEKFFSFAETDNARELIKQRKKEFAKLGKASDEEAIVIHKELDEIQNKQVKLQEQYKNLYKEGGCGCQKEQQSKSSSKSKSPKSTKRTK